MTTTRTHEPTPDTAAPRRRPAWLLPVLVVGAVALTGALALFQPWLLFVDTEVDEQLPAITAPIEPAADADDTGDGAAADDAAPSETEQQDAGTDDPTDQDAPPAPDAAPEPASEPSAATAEPDAEPEPSGPTVLASGQFISRDHETTGTASIVQLEDGSRVVTLEDFRTTNGPDLYVYLDDDPAAAEPLAFDDGLDLGALRGNVGNLVYEIPADADLSDVTSVVIWCDRFSHVFGAADLTFG